MEKKGKYDKHKAIRNNNSFYLLIEKDKNGEIKQVMEKPNLKAIEEEGTISGAHLITHHSERNHIDWYRNKKEIGKERTNMKPFWEEGGNWGLDIPCIQNGKD